MILDDKIKELEYYMCPECNKLFSTIYALKLHFKSKHTDVASTYCPMCNEEFNDVVRHYSALADACYKHAIYYALSCNSHRTRTLKKRHNGFDFIEKHLKVVVRRKEQSL